MTAPRPTPRWDERGLVPAVVQDAATRQVLMVAYMNAEALEATRRTGQAHFWSRSRGELWRKGETSGNVMNVVDVRPDCDDDTLLVLVDPSGPACHTGSRSCFRPSEPETEDQGFAALEALWATIRRRVTERPEGSYTAGLLDRGVDRVVRKVVEEATEVALAAKDHAIGAADDRRVAEEAADLVYHLLVALAERGVGPDRLLAVLAERAGPPDRGHW